MQKFNMKEWVWFQRYRPQTVDDCILPETTKKLFKNMVKQGEIQNLLLSGVQGSGKGSITNALCNDLGLDFMMINASDENGIDVLRTKIKQFASTVGIGSEGAHKVVILDEADSLSPQMMNALRGSIEQYSKNCRFILTCNFKNRIIEPIHSRCTTVDFNAPEMRKPEMLKEMMDRLIFILDNEGVTYKKNVIAEIIFKWAPDFRRIINEAQRYSTANNGVLDQGILLSSQINTDIRELIDALKNKDFKTMRKWVTDHQDTDSSEIFRRLFDLSNECFDPPSIPHLILILAEYGYRAAFVVDQQINTTAALTEIMTKCKVIK